MYLFSYFSYFHIFTFRCSDSRHSSVLSFHRLLFAMTVLGYQTKKPSEWSLVIRGCWCVYHGNAQLQPVSPNNPASPPPRVAHPPPSGAHILLPSWHCNNKDSYSWLVQKKQYASSHPTKPDVWYISGATHPLGGPSPWGWEDPRVGGVWPFVSTILILLLLLLVVVVVVVMMVVALVVIHELSFFTHNCYETFIILHLIASIVFSINILFALFPWTYSWLSITAD